MNSAALFYLRLALWTVGCWGPRYPKSDLEPLTLTITLPSTFSALLVPICEAGTETGVSGVLFSPPHSSWPAPGCRSNKSLAPKETSSLPESQDSTLSHSQVLSTLLCSTAPVSDCLPCDFQLTFAEFILVNPCKSTHCLKQPMAGCHQTPKKKQRPHSQHCCYTPNGAETALLSSLEPAFLLQRPHPLSGDPAALPG